MSKFVNLNRRFRNLDEKELEDADTLASLSDYPFMSPITWEKLLEYSRVLILAEAGSGKTAEMRERAKILADNGKFGFFLPLEALNNGKPADWLLPNELVQFEQWKSDGFSNAWFFLDAVDELKLAQGKLEGALRGIANAVSGLLHRTRIVISCRPHDWRSITDMEVYRTILPSVPVKAIKLPAAEELFLSRLHLNRDNNQSAEASSDDSIVKVVVLLPLSNSQITVFAEALGVANAKDFISEIEQRDAWSFARRPLDLQDLVAVWKQSGKLGTRCEQHEVDVTAKLRERTERGDHDVLSESKARDGVEQLALTLALTRCRTIRVPDQALDLAFAEGVLDAAAVMVDWTESERHALLRRAIFDPATYGRVRFHHRSIQEYLAACRLLKLRKAGMSTKALLRFFFTEKYGVLVLFPSMRPIAAWLALWNADVRRELLSREPELLLSHGDPESLELRAGPRN